MITIKEIALKAGVAKSTVSNVLSGKKYVSPEIANKVMKMCEENDYHPNFYASVLSSKVKTNIIGLFLEISSDGVYKKFYSDLIQSVIKVLNKHGKSLLIYSGLDNGQTTLKMKSGKAPIDGAIILSPTINDSRIVDFKDHVIPFVIIGHPVNAINTNYVDVDNTKLTNFIATSMIDKGFNSICLINSNKELVISKERDYGFMCAFEGRKATFEIKHTNSTKEEAYVHAKESLKRGTNAFITASGIVASGVYQACKEAGKVIGKEVAVFTLGYSFDVDMEFEPSLSYAVQDYFMLGKCATEILVDVIDGKKDVINETIDNQIHYHDSFK